MIFFFFSFFFFFPFSLPLLCIGPRGSELRRVADLRAKRFDIDGIHIGDRDDHVRHARVDHVPTHVARGEAERDLAVVVGSRQADLHAPLVKDLRLDDAGDGLKPHRLSGESARERKPADAPRAVAAHLRLAAVGVEKPPGKVELRVLLHEDHAVRSDGLRAPTDLAHELRHVAGRQKRPAVVDDQKVIAGSGQLGKRDVHDATPHLSRRDCSARARRAL